MKKEHSIVSQFSYWMGSINLVMGCVDMVIREDLSLSIHFALGMFFWGLAQLEVNAKYLKDIRDKE